MHAGCSPKEWIGWTSSNATCARSSRASRTTPKPSTPWEYTLADRTDRYEEAYELIKRAYELKPDDHYIVDSMGWILYRLGRHREALEQLRRAMSIRPDPEIAVHLGEVLWILGQKAEARGVWEAALEDTPEDERLLDAIERFDP